MTEHLFLLVVHRRKSREWGRGLCSLTHQMGIMLKKNRSLHLYLFFSMPLIRYLAIGCSARICSVTHSFLRKFMALAFFMLFV